MCSCFLLFMIIILCRSRWASHPYSQGTYSYPRVGSTPNDVIALSAPIVRK